jgi:hypothetical protein
MRVGQGVPARGAGVLRIVKPGDREAARTSAEARRLFVRFPYNPSEAFRARHHSRGSLFGWGHERLRSAGESSTRSSAMFNFELT